MPAREDHLRQELERCRRMAETCRDPSIALAFRTLAADYERLLRDTDDCPPR